MPKPQKEVTSVVYRNPLFGNLNPFISQNDAVSVPSIPSLYYALPFPLPSSFLALYLLMQPLKNNFHIRIPHKQNLNIKLVQPDSNITPNSSRGMHLRFQIKLHTHHQLNFPATSVLPLSSCPKHRTISIISSTE